MSALASWLVAGSELAQELFAGLSPVLDFKHRGFGTCERIGGTLSGAGVSGFQLVDGGTRFGARFIRAQKCFVHGYTRFVDRLNAGRRDGQTHEGVDPLSARVEVGVPKPFDAVDQEARLVSLVVSTPE